MLSVVAVTVVAVTVVAATVVAATVVAATVVAATVVAAAVVAAAVVAAAVVAAAVVAAAVAVVAAAVAAVDAQLERPVADLSGVVAGIGSLPKWVFFARTAPRGTPHGCSPRPQHWLTGAPHGCYPPTQHLMAEPILQSPGDPAHIPRSHCPTHCLPAASERQTKCNVFII